MQIKIHTHHVHLGEEREAIINEKFEKITHYAHRISDDSSEIKVDLTHEEARKDDEQYLCAVTLFIPRDTIRAEARSASLENAVDAVIEKLKAPIEHYKDKTHHISDRKN